MIKNLNSVKASISERDSTIEIVIKKRGKEFGFNDVYGYFTDDMYKKYLSKANYLLKIDSRNLNDDGTTKFIENFGKQSLAGSNDYKDHRNDTLDMIKKQIKPVRPVQILHFIDWEKKDLCFDILLEGYLGGRKAHFNK